MKTYYKFQNRVYWFWYSDRHMRFLSKTIKNMKPIPDWVDCATRRKLGMEINMMYGVLLVYSHRE
jgi:hypothetical protein